MATAVICEFNPFHNGHKYLLETAKRLTGEPVIAIMSGSFAQRGEVCVTDKFFRAKTALENGADLVVELPAVYAVSNAQRFAACGVHIAKSFGCVKHLAFGCESDNINNLCKAASSIENESVQNIIREEMKGGNYYPRALEIAVRRIFGDEIADVLTSPNNILAVEYIRNLADSSVKPLPIMRTGVSHNSEQTSGNYASASQIRKMLRENAPADLYLPEVPKQITYSENLERMVLYKLRSMSADDYKRLPDVNEGLENRIMDAVRRYNSVKEILDAVKTKRYTYARIRRIIVCALLGITEQLQTVPVEYARILGFNSEGASLLKTSRLEVVTSVSDALKKGGNTAKLLEKDILSTDIAALAYNKPEMPKSDFTFGIIKIV